MYTTYIHTYTHTHTYTHICMYIYMYIYCTRERFQSGNVHKCIFMYLYIAEMSASCIHIAHIRALHTHIYLSIHIAHI